MTFTNLHENRFPGNAESIVLIHFCHTAIEFLCLGIGERYFRWICRQAIPQFFDQVEPLLRTQFINVDFKPSRNRSLVLSAFADKNGVANPRARGPAKYSLKKLHLSGGWLFEARGGRACYG